MEKLASSLFKCTFTLLLLTTSTTSAFSTAFSRRSNVASVDDVLFTRIELMKNYMNTSVDPCENFYQYACGNFNQIHPMEGDEVENHLFNVVKTQVDLALRDLLEASENIIGEDEIRYSATEHKLKMFYESCMNTELIEERRIDPLVHQLDSLGGWPILDRGWNEQDFDWKDLLVSLKKLNFDIFLSIEVFMDLLDPETYIIYINSGGNSRLYKSDFAEKTNSTRYNINSQYMINILKLFGVAPEIAHQATADILDFEGELSQWVEDFDLGDDHRKITIRELNSQFEGIEWLSLLSAALNTSLDINQEVSIYEANMLKNFHQLISKTPSSIVANYMLWKFVEKYIQELDSRFDNEIKKLLQVFNGQMERPARWKRCLENSKELFNDALGSMYIRKHFDEASKRDIIRLGENLKDIFQNFVQQQHWLKDTTKSIAQNKIETMKLFLGYNDDLLNSTKLNTEYVNVEIHSDKYFENLINLQKLKVENNNKLLGQKVDKNKWILSPFKMDAGYVMNKNKIEFPAAILQPPFYHRTYPKVLNIGGIGTFIGHEIGHGLSESGLKFNAGGVLENWMDEESKDFYNEIKKCFVDQYNSYSMLNHSIDGAASVSENIPDNVGLRVAFTVYKNWLEENQNAVRAENERIPGLNLSNKQLFFLTYSQIWCGSIRPEALRKKIATDKHCPTEIRILGTISNSADFAEAYGCKLNSPMNPERKCKLW